MDLFIAGSSSAGIEIYDPNGIEVFSASASAAGIWIHLPIGYAVLFTGTAVRPPLQ